MTKITVNGVAIDADPKQPLIHACHTHDVDVPMYCYHPGLTPVGSCRICQVEVKQGDGPARVVVACRTPVAEGMVVNTEAPKAHDARRECLEFLLKNHPLDCPICDKAGECDLQDYSFAEGQGEGRSNEPRRKLEKRKPLGDVIVLDEERCILCSRCVRFFEDVTKKPQLTVTDLGSRSFISTFMDRPLTGNYQGNLADICPVGALTLKKFRFQARVWNLSKHASTCAECSRGCSISVEVLRGGEVKRFRPRYDAAVNQWWMCDIGRFAFEHVDAKTHLAGAVKRGAGGLEVCATDAALEHAAEWLAGASGSIVVASPFATNEEAGAAKALATKLGAKLAFVSPAPNGLKDDLLHTGDPCPNRRGLSELGFAPMSADEVGAQLSKSSSALLVGERIVELIGRAKLSTATAKLFVFDAAPCDAPKVEISVGVPSHVEKNGHWTNVDGHARRLTMARSPLSGVRPLDTSLALLTELLNDAGVKAR